MVEKMHYFLVPLLNLHSNKSCRIMVIRVASFRKKNDFCRKKESHSHRCVVGFWSQFKKLSQPKIRKYFKLLRVEMIWEQDFFCLFRNICPEKLVQSMVKVGYFFQYLTTFTFRDYNFSVEIVFLGLQYSPHTCVPEYPMYFNDLFVCTNQGRPGYKIWSTFLQKQISCFLYYKNRILSRLCN